MFGKKYEAAHADWPKTNLTRDGGVLVTGKYWRPNSEEIWRTLYLIASGIATIAALAAGGLGAGIVIFVLLVIAWEVAIKHLAFLLFGKNLNVKIYADRIALPSFFGYKNYSREMPMEFRIEQHQGVLQGPNRAKLYRDAIEAVMQYGEKRVVLAEMPQKHLELARALVIRLQNVCESIDMAKSISGGNSRMKPATSGDFGPVPDIR